MHGSCGNQVSSPSYHRNTSAYTIVSSIVSVGSLLTLRSHCDSAILPTKAHHITANVITIPLRHCESGNTRLHASSMTWPLFALALKCQPAQNK